MQNELRPYQTEGVARIVEILRQRKSAYLADDMGLGKTAQAIRVSEMLDAKRILVVCPASLRLNWEREIHQWAPGRFSSLPIFGSADNLQASSPFVTAVIVSYDLAGKLLIGSNPEFDLLILDEVHYCKNPQAKRTKACLKTLWNISTYRLVMSGTPLPNGVIDGFTVFNRLAPEIFTDRYKYGFRYTNAERNWFTGGWEFKGGKNLKELKEKVRPFMVRRRKQNVLTELPPKVYSQIPIDVKAGAEYRLTPEQEAMLKDGAIANLSTQCATQRRGLGILKAPAAVEYIREVAREKKRLVVFGFHRDVLGYLADGLSDAADRVAVISGSTPAAERDAIVQDFQSEDEKSFILLGQITAAGIGITLTAADTCIFAELDWVPANMGQAIDRLSRIGQKASVAIHYLIARGTMDEQIIGTLMQKVKAINEVLN